jgi:hypothetical protein
MIELSIKVKDEKSSLVEKHLVYETLILHRDDSFLRQCVSDAMDKFKKDPESEAPDITIKIKMVW